MLEREECSVRKSRETERAREGKCRRSKKFDKGEGKEDEKAKYKKRKSRKTEKKKHRRRKRRSKPNWIKGKYDGYGSMNRSGDIV